MTKIFTIVREAKGKILKRKDLDSLADKYNFDKIKLRKLLLNKGYLITLFRGIYYLRGYEEKKFNNLRYSPYELLSIGLGIKGIKWYFGLNTALKFLNLTHEVFPVNYVINNKFNRIKPMSIAGSSFLFIKIKPSLFFGIKNIKTENAITLNYSNLAKTILDFFYLKREINLNEYDLKKEDIIKYSARYNKNVKRRLKEEL